MSKCILYMHITAELEVYWPPVLIWHRVASYRYSCKFFMAGFCFVRTGFGLKCLLVVVHDKIHLFYLTLIWHAIANWHCHHCCCHCCCQWQFICTALMYVWLMLVTSYVVHIWTYIPVFACQIYTICMKSGVHTCLWHIYDNKMQCIWNICDNKMWSRYCTWLYFSTHIHQCYIYTSLEWQQCDLFEMWWAYLFLIQPFSNDAVLTVVP